LWTAYTLNSLNNVEKHFSFSNQEVLGEKKISLVNIDEKQGVCFLPEIFQFADFDWYV